MLSKGNIIHAGRINVKDMVVINIPLLITSEMLPAFRIVAYYVLPWQHRVEVVADSVFVDVEDRCVGSVSSCDVCDQLLRVKMHILALYGTFGGQKQNDYSNSSSSPTMRV